MKKKTKKKTRGRPKGSTKELKRDAHIQIRLFNAEKAEYAAAAEYAGMSLTDWVKKACDDKLAN